MAKVEVMIEHWNTEGAKEMMSRCITCKIKNSNIFSGDETLRTIPSSGQAAFNSQLRPLMLLACHSGAAFGGLLNISSGNPYSSKAYETYDQNVAGCSSVVSKATLTGLKPRLK